MQTVLITFAHVFCATVCPGSSDPFYIAGLLYNMGHYFLDILYDGTAEGQLER